MSCVKKGSVYNRILLAVLAALLLIGGIGAIFFPAPMFSESENRMLASFPTVSAEGLSSGSYTAAIDTYLAERFPWREPLRHLYAAADLALGKMQSSGVLLREGDTLLAEPSPNATVTRKNLSALKRLFGEANALSLPFHVAAIPHRTNALLSLCPPFYKTPRTEHEALKSTLPDAHILTHLNEKRDWYRTDHHLTTRGAYRVYVALSGMLGYTPYTERDFQTGTASGSFLGTLDAKAGLTHITPDSITLWRFAGDTEYLVKRDGKNAYFDAFYDHSSLQTRDQYAVFCGGNCGTLEISLGARDTRPTLLVVKDSYANTVLPFLARHFRIIAIDPRYADSHALLTALQAADLALMLFGMQTITESPFLK